VGDAQPGFVGAVEDVLAEGPGGGVEGDLECGRPMALRRQDRDDTGGDRARGPMAGFDVLRVHGIPFASPVCSASRQRRPRTIHLVRD